MDYEQLFLYDKGFIIQPKRLGLAPWKYNPVDRGNIRHFDNVYQPNLFTWFSSVDERSVLFIIPAIITSLTGI